MEISPRLTLAHQAAAVTAAVGLLQCCCSSWYKTRAQARLARIPRTDVKVITQ